MKLILLITLCMFNFLGNAQTVVTGKTVVVPNSIETYTVTWEFWGSDYQNYANVYWDVSYGTILSSDKHSVTIQWADIPTWLNQSAGFNVSEDLGGQNSGLPVEIVNFVLGESEYCTGIKGPAAVAATFGAGLNPGAELPSGISTYTYTTSCALYPGQYTVTNNTSACRSDWLALSEDHTPGDVNGYMLMVDGSEQRGTVYQSLVTGLVDAFEYEFSAYIANLGSVYDRPLLKFEIRDLAGNLIQTSPSFRIEYDAGNPWKQVAFTFTLPPGTTSLNVYLINENNEGLGNDFVVDDIAFAPCYPPILASFSNTTVQHKEYICNNGTVNLYSRWPTPSIPFTNPSFRWQKSSNNGVNWFDIPSATSMNHTMVENTPGVFLYRMYAYETSTPTNFVISNSITYFVQRMVLTVKNHDIYTCSGSPMVLSPNYYLEFSDPAGPTLTYTFTWTPGTRLSSTTIANPTITLPVLPPAAPNADPPPPTSYVYNLTIVNNNFAGCSASATQTVNHFNPRRVAIPNAFTPDGDGLNDLYRPLNLQDYRGGKFWIYNRWGQLVFYSTGPTLLDFSWDGRFQGVMQEAGVYTWQVEIPGCPTNIYSQNNTPYGNVTIVR